MSSDGDIWSSHVRCHVVSRSASDRALFDIALTKTVASSNAAVCDAQSRFLFNNYPTFAAAGRRVAALRVPLRARYRRHSYAGASTSSWPRAARRSRWTSSAGGTTSAISGLGRTARADAVSGYDGRGAEDQSKDRRGRQGKVLQAYEAVASICIGHAGVGVRSTMSPDLWGKPELKSFDLDPD